MKEAFQYVPVLKTLKAILNQPEVLAEVCLSMHNISPRIFSLGMGGRGQEGEEVNQVLEGYSLGEKHLTWRFRSGCTCSL